MLPSARRAELSRLEFENSYLSRDVLAASSKDASDKLSGGGASSGKSGFGKPMESIYSHTTAGVTTLEDFDQEGFARMRKRAPLIGNRHVEDATRYLLSPATFSRAGSSHFSYDDSDFSDDDSLGSVNSEDSVGTTATKYASIRYSNSTAGQIWSILNSLDDLVLHVKANTCQCRRLGARFAALKKPMVAVHKGRQTADESVLFTIKELVTEAQRFVERFLDPDWWRKGAGRKEESETFRELTFRLGFLMQAPPGFKEQSQEEDHADRLKDYADLQVYLEEKLQATTDSRTTREITHVLRRIKMREATDGAGGAAEIELDTLELDQLQESFKSGGFGTVSMASMGTTQVAVKKLNNQNLSLQLLKDFRREVEVFRQLQYDFVGRVFGACTYRPNLCIIYERAPQNLFDFLHGDSGPSLDIPPAEKAAMLYDIVRGVHFLHVKKIVHGALKSTNVMVFENNCLKVCDFGLISLREANAGLGAGTTVPMAAWTAPEVLDDQMPSILSDIYSFGIIIHEVLTQRIPFAGKSVAKVITAVVAKGHRPGYLECEQMSLPSGLIRLGNTCWAQEAEARPKCLSSVVMELGHIISAFGGDPRARAYEQPAGKSTPQSSKPGSGALQVNDLSAEAQRIVALEHEVRQLKAQARMAAALNAGSIGPGSMSSGGDFNGDFLGAGVIQGSSTSYTPKGSSGGRFQHRHTESPGFPEERHALRSLYTATQGPGWKQISGWETNEADISRWYGIVCSEEGHVISIQLLGNNLRGQIPRELSGLAHLRTLILADNKLEGSIPAELGQLARLSEVDFSMNDLSGAIPSNLSKAVSLENVQLQCNALTGVIPRSMLNLHNLKVFVVDWNSLADTYPFRKFRKASPPCSEQEISRALSDTRKQAVARAKQAFRLKKQQERQGQDLTKTPTRSRPATRGTECTHNSRIPNHQSPAQSATSTPLLSRFPRGAKKASSDSGAKQSRSSRSDTHSDTACPSEMIAGGSRASTSGEEVSSRPGSGCVGKVSTGAAYVAPTAPYQGDDGILGQERAKAAANKAVPEGKFRKAMRAWGKTFREVIGGDLHPGFTADVDKLREEAEEIRKKHQRDEVSNEC